MISAIQTLVNYWPTSLLSSWSTVIVFKRCLPRSRYYSGDMDVIIEALVANMGLDVRGRFLPATERNSKLSCLEPIPCGTATMPITVQRASTSSTPVPAELTDNWNVAALLCGDGEFHLTSGSFFGSNSLDGAVSGFWPLIWDSRNITWAPKMHHHFIDWPYRAVTRAARLLRRQGKGFSRPFVYVEGYLRNAALVLIKNTLKRWLLENPGFGILLGGPGARAPNLQTTKYYVRRVKISEFGSQLYNWRSL